MEIEVYIALLLALNTIVTFWLYRDLHSFIGRIVVKGKISEKDGADGGMKND